ncbi:STAS domain-containing protein [Heliorestis acidaminivorans]|uniref:STAS domain-containing protein n=1 Tax=Heliorestis acidaminivorans TaxID=553427 RepID=UPI001478A7EE|nr:STAS domain-containing protein [Heliorestis acidaminivorans]
MLDYEIIEKEEILVIRFYGSIGAENAQKLKKAFQTLPEENHKLVINLGVSFITSEAIGYLIQIYKKYREKKGEVILCNVSGNVRTVLEMIRLNKVITILESEEKALERLS